MNKVYPPTGLVAWGGESALVSARVAAASTRQDSHIVSTPVASLYEVELKKCNATLFYRKAK